MKLLNSSAEEYKVWMDRLGQALETQRRKEEGWTSVTMNDRLSKAWREMSGLGIVALEDAGYTTSDGWSDVHEERFESAPDSWGAVFFHRQDIERAISGAGLYITFGAFSEGEDHESLSLDLAAKVCELLEKDGIPTQWDGTIGNRILIKPFVWQKRRWTNALGAS